MSKVSNPLVFTREEVQMHHGSYIRNDVKSKLINSSSRAGFINNIDKIVDYYNTWEYPNKVMWSGQLLNVKQTKNLFI
jgi:hypothetical protein